MGDREKQKGTARPAGGPTHGATVQAKGGHAAAKSGLRPTASTISKLAGVSTSTVSRALKGDPSISARTRRRIAELAEQLGYRPNAMARGLITRRSNVVALIMGEMANPFYSEQLERLLSLLGERDIQLMLFHVPPGRDVQDVIPMVLQYQLDGCIIAAVSLSSTASDTLAAHDLPNVMINRVPAHRHGCAVLCDNQAGGFAVADFLADRGMRRPAFVAGKSDTSTSRDRERGFLEGLRHRKLELQLRLEGDYTFEGGARAGRAILDSTATPDAVFCANDIMALGLMDQLRRGAVAIPGDMQIVGFDDIRAAAWPSYDLSTVAQPMDALLQRAVTLITARIQDPSLLPETVYIAGTIRERGTTRPKAP